MKNSILLFIVVVFIISCKPQETSRAIDAVKEMDSAEPMITELTTSKKIKPEIDIISHATFIMDWNGTTIYIDPVGGATLFESKPAADLILVTDIHGDHADATTLTGVVKDAPLVTPQAVATKIGNGFEPTILANGETATIKGFKITAVPMYNLTAERLKFHDKGRGNGYVIEKDGYRVYISGDTEDIPEMRALKNIDLAFVCMNLPYTMIESQAASAVVAFSPSEVIPYHYRGTEGKLDISKFKALVNKEKPTIKVTLMDWYPE